MTLLSPLCSKTLPKMRESERGGETDKESHGQRKTEERSLLDQWGIMQNNTEDKGLSKLIMPGIFFILVSNVYFRNTLCALTFLRHFNYGMLYKALWSIYTDHLPLA